MATPTPFARCSAKVDAGASMVRGWHNKRPCEAVAVFADEVEPNKNWCAVHAKGRPGFMPKVKPEKKSWRIFYTKPDGRKSSCYVWEAVSERGARSAFARQSHHAGCKIIGVIPNVPDAEFNASPAAQEWKEFTS